MSSIKATPLTIRVSPEEMAEIDRNWRSDFSYRSRTDYVRSKIGLRKSLSRE